MKIKFNDLSAQWKEIESETLPQILDILGTGNYILGQPVSVFESNFSEWNGNKFSVGVANGTDAIKLAVRSLDLKGRSVFYIPANTYIASVLGVIFSNIDVRIELIDCDEYFQIDTIKLEESIQTLFGQVDNQIIMPVHLYGHSCNMEEITKIATKYNCMIVEDCSQAHGTLAYNNNKVGTFGTVNAFSLYPGKNLGAAGDAGVITTNNSDIHNNLLKLRNLGSTVKYQHDIIGWNSRLDTIQACILTSKLKKLNEWNNKKLKIAEIYNTHINETDILTLPKTASYCKKHTYHIYSVLTSNREQFQEYLNSKGIPTLVHYPVPIEKSGAFKHLNVSNQKTREYSKKLVSLPMHPFLLENEIDYIVTAINQFKGKI